MEVGLLPPAAARDEELAGALSALVNTVYATAEAGLWRAGSDRTSPSELAGLVAAGEIAVARSSGDLSGDVSGDVLGDVLGTVAGCVRVREIADGVGEFGLLAAAPHHQGAGLGRRLVRFAEDHCRNLGHRTMQLELLVPRDFEHPSKRFLAAWYTRLGYRPDHRTPFERDYSHLAPLLAVPCELAVYRKDLD
ncbi:MAG TPA: GNAT family N-acetyltransferase [Amycolatopsis sp.]|nr:GNAT family N-acetyltransferase [Amycolatopsis sp.]